MEKKITVATVAKRMNRILAAYREQCARETQTEGTPPVASTSSSSSASSTSSPSSSGETNCTAERKMELDKAILNYASQMDSELDSDLDLSDRNYSFIESSRKRRSSSQLTTTTPATTDNDQHSKRRRQPTRTVKRAAVKITSMGTMKRVPRKVTCTITSSNASSPDPPKSSNISSRSSMSMALADSDDDSDSDTVTVKPIKTSSIIFKATSKSTCVQPM